MDSFPKNIFLRELKKGPIPRNSKEDNWEREADIIDVVLLLGQRQRCQRNIVYILRLLRKFF